MQLRSLGRKTDLIFSRFQGEVFDRGPFLVIRTPTNPSFHWGNLLVFAAPPTANSLTEWNALFKKELGDLPLKHTLFTWEGLAPEDSVLKQFTDEGFEFDEGVVLATKKVKAPPKVNSDIKIKVIESDSEWAQAIELQVAARDPQYEEGYHRLFKERQFAQYKAMWQAGMGHWFGAFLGGKLVGDLGVFKSENLARYQNVSTHPDYRRLGICGTIVYETAKLTLQDPKIETLVMEADNHYHAARIYESVGFLPVEKNHSLYRAES
ncbi:MAG: GNAT family N-acetyltransferase [Bdellovibrionota bacterium]